MKKLKQLLFAAIVVIGISMTASAQDGKGKKPPPKDPPPVIVAPDKNHEKPKEDKPKNDDKRKRPDMFGFKEE